MSAIVLVGHRAARPCGPGSAAAPGRPVALLRRAAGAVVADRPAAQEPGHDESTTETPASTISPTQSIGLDTQSPTQSPTASPIA